MRLTAIRGTRDLLPEELVRWRAVEETAREVFGRYGYREIRTPLFEATELFVRGVGAGTDIVEKEMYTFEDRGGRSLTLRPEGTAAVVRACLEHNLFAELPVLKLYYIGPMYRYERPQAGRYREFWQAGVEAFGSDDPALDAEVILCAYDFLTGLGLRSLTIHLNSLGDEERQTYVQALREYLAPHWDRLPARDRERFEKNPLRMLDSKEEITRALIQEAPQVLDFLSEKSRHHLETVCRLLEREGVPYRVNPHIVRGLDYYTHTVFEVTAEGLGAQDAVLAGGRYDHLVEEVGGRPTPGVGFAAGVDRLLLALEAQGVAPEPGPELDLYIAVIGEVRAEALALATRLRRAGYRVDLEFLGRSLRAQMKTAHKRNVPLVALLGEDELREQRATLRDMRSGEQRSVSLEELIPAVAQMLSHSNPN
ncbi:MAG: histidine--tRNA ligase [Candidatus Poribacteria bacterium]|nr:MAG: histidine--tRNA ligase [Candidatus Poribacteria bacterium]